VAETEGYEIKGLAYPGREGTYDCNSQVPSGFHNGRTIYYVFGRYPSQPDGDRYPVLDLVTCHGDFLNAYHEYVQVGEIVRRETDRLLAAYSFDLKENRITAKWVDNPARGREHCFRAYRVTGDSTEHVSLRAE
jgi:hypothetical protein